MRILKRIFGPKRDENGECGRVHKELHSGHRSPNRAREIKSRTLRWTGHVARMQGKSAFEILTGKHSIMRPLGWPKRRWEDNIKIDFKEVAEV